MNEMVDSIDAYLREHQGATWDQICAEFGITRSQFNRIRRAAYRDRDMRWDRDRHYRYFAHATPSIAMSNIAAVLLDQIGKQRTQISRAHLALRDFPGDENLIRATRELEALKQQMTSSLGTIEEMIEESEQAGELEPVT